MTLSSAEVSVPLCRREHIYGKRENESASETMGRRKSSHLLPLPMVHRAITISNYSIANYQKLIRG